MDGDFKSVERAYTLTSSDPGPAAGVDPAMSATAPATEPPKPAYPPEAAVPTMAGPHGIRLDFNHGARVLLPNCADGKWRVRLSDRDTGNILFESENRGALVNSAKRYYVRFVIEVWDVDDAGAATQVLSHECDTRDRDVLILF